MKIYLSPSDQNRNIYAYGDTNEMTQCRRMADACEAALKRHGFDVINNKKDTMEQRVAESNAWGADLHIPIHTNAHNGEVTGTRMFYAGKDSPGKAPCQAIFARLAPLTPGTSESISTYPELYELRVPNAASVYIEVDFHDVPKIAKWLIENPAVIGEAICAGICDYYGIEYKSAEAEEGGFTYERFKEYVERYESERAELPGSDWSKTERAWAQHQGIITGDDQGRMKWRSPITREEYAATEYRREVTNGESNG